MAPGVYEYRFVKSGLLSVKARQNKREKVERFYVREDRALVPTYPFDNLSAQAISIHPGRILLKFLRCHHNIGRERAIIPHVESALSPRHRKADVGIFDIINF